MIKKLTGVEYTPEEFRTLKQCVRCGHAVKNILGEVCEPCFDQKVGQCDMCEVLLRNGVYSLYTYDIKSEHREGEDFIVSKQSVREFEYQVEFNNPANDDFLCGSCITWGNEIRNHCGGCDKHFLNDRENYKENGNFCGECSHKINKKLDEQEVSDDKSTGEGVRDGSNENQGVSGAMPERVN